MHFTHDVIDCGGFYDSRRQPMYILEAEKPGHRNLVPMMPVYEGEWWTLDGVREFNNEDQEVPWAKNAPSSQLIRIPMFSYNFGHQSTSVLPCLGFELSSWLMRNLPLPRLERIHLVMSNNIYEIGPGRHQTWLGVGCQLG